MCLIVFISALDIQHCGLSNKGADQIRNLVTINATLVVVDIRNNPLVKTEMLQRIMEILQDNNKYTRSEVCTCKGMLHFLLIINANYGS